MWIFLSIVLFLALLIFIFLLLPVYIIIKLDKENKVYFRIKFLNKLYGEKSDSDSKILGLLKRATGVSDLETDEKFSLFNIDTLKALKNNLELVFGLLKEVAGLVKKCTATVFKLNISCAANNAADAAISYGQCCSFTYPALGFLHSVIKFKKSGEEINVSCNYDNNQSSFSLETVLAVKIFHIVAALLRVVIFEAKRAGKNEALNAPDSKKEAKEK